MELDIPQPAARRRSYVRAFLPLFSWFVISSMPLAVTMHREALSRTMIFFQLSIDGKLIDVHHSWPYSAHLGSAVIHAGSPLSLGCFGLHRLNISAQDAIPTNKWVFLWYGKNNAGIIDLKAYRGTLALRCKPAASEVRLVGPLYESLLSHCGNTNLNIPVGKYQVTAVYDHYSAEYPAVVSRNQTASLQIQPDIGNMTIGSEPNDSDFYLFGDGQAKMLEGKTPKTISGLPAGSYTLRIWRGDYTRELPVTVRSGETNNVLVSFDYGTLTVVSQPSAALFSGQEELGKTPLTDRSVR